jgi:hypothetical protein
MRSASLLTPGAAAMTIAAADMPVNANRAARA